jgi:hypothetical protein
MPWSDVRSQLAGYQRSPRTVLAFFHPRIRLCVHVAAIGVDSGLLGICRALVVPRLDILSHPLVLLVFALPVVLLSFFLAHVSLERAPLSEVPKIEVFVSFSNVTINVSLAKLEVLTSRCRA